MTVMQNTEVTAPLASMSVAAQSLCMLLDHLRDMHRLIN